MNSVPVGTVNIVCSHLISNQVIQNLYISAKELLINYEYDS